MHTELKDIKTPHILIVDDKPDNIKSVINILLQQKWKVTVVKSAKSGYQHAIALKPDLILLDVVMPGMDGFAMSRLLGESISTKTIPVIFLTSSGLLDERLKGFELGGVDYIIKPCEAEEVLARIKLHLNLKNIFLIEKTHHLIIDDADIHGGDENDTVLFHAAIKFIDGHLSDVLSLSLIASSVGTYDKKLSRIFRLKLNMTVFEYIRDVRLKKAKQLLKSSDMCIQDIATLTGYLNACNFTTSFRKAHGLTPMEYRRHRTSINNNVYHTHS